MTATSTSAELISEARDPAQADSPAHDLMRRLAEALEESDAFKEQYHEEWMLTQKALCKAETERDRADQARAVVSEMSADSDFPLEAMWKARLMIALYANPKTESEATA